MQGRSTVETITAVESRFHNETVRRNDRICLARTLKPNFERITFLPLPKRPHTRPTGGMHVVRIDPDHLPLTIEGTWTISAQRVKVVVM